MDISVDIRVVDCCDDVYLIPGYPALDACLMCIIKVIHTGQEQLEIEASLCLLSVLTVRQLYMEIIINETGNIIQICYF